jgi:hypothetical protein
MENEQCSLCWCDMKTWMIWGGLAVVIIAGAALGMAKVLDPHDACRNSGGKWVDRQCQY